MDDYQRHRLQTALGHAAGATPITVTAGDLRAALEDALALPEALQDLDEATSAMTADERADLEGLARDAWAEAADDLDAMLDAHFVEGSPYDKAGTALVEMWRRRAGEDA